MTIRSGLDTVHRDEMDEINRKAGDTLVRTLRRLYRPSFASGFSDSDTLTTVIRLVPNHRSLWQLRVDYRRGDLPTKP